MTSTDATDPTPPSGRALLEHDDGVLSVRIHNPARANALDADILAELEKVFADPPTSARAALLGGDGDRHFSSGLDLTGTDADRLAADLRSGERLLGRVADAVEGCRIPVIGVVNGACFGGALELAMACDWRLAASGARLGMPAARIGVVYSPEGLRRFVADLGAARAKELFLTGEPVDADRARDIGLVDRVIPGGELWEAARRSARAVADAAPLAVAGTRELIDRVAAGESGPALSARAGQLRDAAFDSLDLREGIAAARAKRAPRFTGR
jgi:enoyl-CoA hydratase/carnithine racemase